MTKPALVALVALTALAIGAVEGVEREIAVDERFLVPQDVADQLVAEGTARLDPDPVDQTPPAASKSKAVKARLLIDGDHGRCNDVVELPADVAKALADAGQADTSKAAIAFAAALPQNQRPA